MDLAGWEGRKELVVLGALVSRNRERSRGLEIPKRMFESRPQSEGRLGIHWGQRLPCGWVKRPHCIRKGFMYSIGSYLESMQLIHKHYFLTKTIFPLPPPPPKKKEKKR